MCRLKVQPLKGAAGDEITMDATQAGRHRRPAVVGRVPIGQSSVKILIDNEQVSRFSL